MKLLYYSYLFSQAGTLVKSVRLSSEFHMISLGFAQAGALGQRKGCHDNYHRSILCITKGA